MQANDGCFGFDKAFDGNGKRPACCPIDDGGNYRPELETSRWMGCESSLCELPGIDKAPSHKALYKAARLLYNNKAAIETFLYRQMEDKYPDTKQLRLFDLTDFYFEGRKEESEQAQFGRSREKRSDAKLISLAMLTSGRGFVCKSKFHKGNISESGTLEEITDDLEKNMKQSVNRLSLLWTVESVLLKYSRLAVRMKPMPTCIYM
jgi:hypothetical protein